MDTQPFWSREYNFYLDNFSSISSIRVNNYYNNIVWLQQIVRKFSSTTYATMQGWSAAHSVVGLLSKPVFELSKIAIHMWLGLTKSVLLPMPADLIFHYEWNGTWTTKSRVQNKLHLSGLVAFLSHSGDLYKLSGAQIEAWPVLGWLWVAVKLCGAE